MSEHRHNAKIRRLPPCTVAGCWHRAEALEQVLQELSVRFDKIRCKCGAVGFRVLDVPPCAARILGELLERRRQRKSHVP